MKESGGAPDPSLLRASRLLGLRFIATLPPRRAVDIGRRGLALYSAQQSLHTSWPQEHGRQWWEGAKKAGGERSEAKLARCEDLIVYVLEAACLSSLSKVSQSVTSDRQTRLPRGGKGSHCQQITLIRSLSDGMLSAVSLAR